MARFIMILVLGAIITYGVTSITLNEYTSQGTQNSMDDYSYNRAHDIANGMVDVVLMRIANDSKYRMTSPQTEDLFSGSVSFTAENTFFGGDSLVKILVSANYNGALKSVTVFTKAIDFNSNILPPSVKAAVTTNNPVKTNGLLIVDGRDHDLAGGLISNKGKVGIWSIATINQSGNSKIGGTESSIDYSPSKPGNPVIIVENQSWPGGIPDTPDKIMGGIAEGYYEGTLKNAAILGFGGSQYVNNPANLNFPLKGITYVELPPGDEWTNARLEGEGVLIVHNSASNAIIKNLDKNYNFKGLLIADDIVHVHNEIIGSIFVLTLFPSSGNVLGNGKGKVLYSNEALLNAVAESQKIAITKYGFGKKRLAVKHWYE